MSKPTFDQIKKAYEQWDGTDKEFMDAVIAQGWASAEDFPQLGDDGNFIKTTDEQPTEVQNEGEKTYDDYIKTWNDEISKLDKDMPLMDKAQIVVDGYRKLWDEKNKLTSKYDSGKGLDRESYNQKLNEINKALKEAEQSPELKSIVDTIRESGGASFESKYLHPMINTTLEQMAIGIGSKAGNEIGESFNNWAGGDHQNSWFRRIQGSEYGLDKLPEIYDKYNGGTKSSEETKEESKGSSEYGPLKPKTPNIKKSTDEMVFGDDVAGVGGEEYVESRNNKLATALKLKGIKSKEDINKFLNQYPSWKNAKDEWKKKTLKSLVEKVGNIETEKEKKSIFNKDNLIKDDEGNTIGVKHVDIKKKKVGDDWTPSDDDSINGVEEDIFNEDNLIKDKEGKTTGVKHISIKKKK